MDSFYQRYVYARIGSETSRRKACPPRLPSGFCLASCSHRIKDMPCLWSGEESFAGERGKMEEDLNICQTGAAEFCYASDFWLFLLVLGGGGRKKTADTLYKNVSQSAMQLPSRTCCAMKQQQAIQMKTVQTVSCSLCSSITKQINLISLFYFIFFTCF